LNKIKTCNFKHNNVPAAAKKLDPAPTFTEKLDIIDEDIYEEIRQ